MLTKNGISTVRTIGTPKPIELIFPETVEYSLSLFKARSVSCTNALPVPLLKADPMLSNTEASIRREIFVENTKAMEESKVQILEITNACLCPILSEIYPLGISNIKLATLDTRVIKPIVYAVTPGTVK